MAEVLARQLYQYIQGAFHPEQLQQRQQLMLVSLHLASWKLQIETMFIKFYYQPLSSGAFGEAILWPVYCLCYLILLCGVKHAQWHHPAMCGELWQTGRGGSQWSSPAVCSSVSSRLLSVSVSTLQWLCYSGWQSDSQTVSSVTSGPLCLHVRLYTFLPILSLSVVYLSLHSSACLPVCLSVYLSVI